MNFREAINAALDGYRVSRPSWLIGPEYLVINQDAQFRKYNFGVEVAHEGRFSSTIFGVTDFEIIEPDRWERLVGLPYVMTFPGEKVAKPDDVQFIGPGKSPLVEYINQQPKSGSAPGLDWVEDKEPLGDRIGLLDPYEHPVFHHFPYPLSDEDRKTADGIIGNMRNAPPPSERPPKHWFEETRMWHTEGTSYPVAAGHSRPPLAVGKSLPTETLRQRIWRNVTRIFWWGMILLILWGLGDIIVRFWSK